MVNKRLHWGWVLVITMVFALSALASGCSKVSEKASEKVAEKAIESASGGEVKVDLTKDGVKVDAKDGSSSFKTGGDLSWPTSMPSDVPQLNGAKIMNVSEATNADGKTVMVWYQEIKNSDEINQYKTALQSKGWTIAATTNTPESVFISAEKPGWNLSATFSTKEGNGIIAVNEVKK